ncbi:hypothetical protein ACHAQE_008942 [Botrytis cinerea]
MASHSTSNPSTSISLPIPIPTSKSNLQLLPCDPLVDSPAILAQQIAAFSNPHEPFFFVLFPETEEKEKAVKRLVDNWVGDEKAKYVKVVDGDVLDILTTHPSHQRLGAGTLLMQYGTTIADSLDLPAYIEGTIIAKHLYECHGFKAVPDRYIEVDVPEKWRGREERPKIEFFFYERLRSGENRDKSIRG